MGFLYQKLGQYPWLSSRLNGLVIFKPADVNVSRYRQLRMQVVHTQNLDTSAEIYALFDDSIKMCDDMLLFFYELDVKAVDISEDV